jgi:caffeyl-CoA reductase-Etf complex subunit CarE
MEWEWKLIERNCPGCGICADLCPHNAIAMTREMAYPRPVPSACIGCMICVDQCPFDAIAVKAFASASEP